VTDFHPELLRLQLGGMRWLLEKRCETAVRDVIASNLEALEAAGAALVKRTVSRSVFRLDAGGCTLYVKHHRLRSFREALKYLVCPSRAAVEWSASRALLERGIPAARAVALGERRPWGVFREAVLVSEALADARSFAEAVAEDRRWLARAARFVRRLHDADVDHRDLHGGNLVVSGGALTLIDLHRMRIGSPVSRNARVTGVARFLAAVTRLLGDGGAAAFVREYLGPEATADETAHLVRVVGARVRRFRERRYASRTKRCVKRSTGFRRERLGGVTVRRRADFPGDRVLRAIERHRASAAPDRRSFVLKRDHRSRVSVVEVDRGGPLRVCVKEFIRPGIWRGLNDLFRGSRAGSAWVGSHACAVRGVPTPKAFAMAEAGSRSFLITEYVAGADRFNDYAADHGRPRSTEETRRWHRFIREAAAFVRHLHAHRLWHRDLSAKNILVRERDDGWDFFLVDTGDVRLGREPSLDLKVRNLGQLDQIYVKPSRTDRLRFYRAYAAGRPEFDRPELLARIDALSRARHRHWLACGGAEILEERRRQGKPV